MNAIVAFVFIGRSRNKERRAKNEEKWRGERRLKNKVRGWRRGADGSF